MGADKSRRVKPGDFILSNSMSFGRPYILGINGCVHDGWLIISDYQNTFEPLFFYQLLRSDDVQTQFDGSANGACVKNLNSDLVKKVKVMTPPKELQKEFVDFFIQIDKSKFVCYSKYFLWLNFTFVSSTIAYSNVVSILEWPKRCWTCSIGIPLSIAFVANVLLNLCGCTFLIPHFNPIFLTIYSIPLIVKR